jgi:uncharacterized membrane protein YphA (DoxX/SURF4 family)
MIKLNASEKQPDNPDRSLRPHRILFHAVRVVLGFIFIYAAYDKILNPEAFAQVVYNYQILPDQLVNLTALVLPWLELLIGLLLIVGVWLPGATFIGTGLLMVFISSLAFNLIRGLDVHCGCFSSDTAGSPADMLTLLRDTLFLALSIYLFLTVFFFQSIGSKSPGSKSFILRKKDKAGFFRN